MIARSSFFFLPDGRLLRLMEVQIVNGRPVQRWKTPDGLCVIIDHPGPGQRDITAMCLEPPRPLSEDEMTMLARTFFPGSVTCEVHRFCTGETVVTLRGGVAVQGGMARA